MSKLEQHTNWSLLSEAGASSVSSIGGETIKVFDLPEDLALKLGYAATVEIDETSGRPNYLYFGFDEYKKPMPGGRNETRPDDRNCAVAIQESGGSYTLTIDIRNEYEDDEKLRPRGVALIQSSFIAAVESLEIDAE